MAIYTVYEPIQQHWGLSCHLVWLMFLLWGKWISYQGSTQEQDECGVVTYWVSLYSVHQDVKLFCQMSSGHGIVMTLKTYWNIKLCLNLNKIYQCGKKCCRSSVQRIISCGVHNFIIKTACQIIGYCNVFIMNDFLWMCIKCMPCYIFIWNLHD